MAEKQHYIPPASFLYYFFQGRGAAFWLPPTSENHSPKLEDTLLPSSPSHMPHTMTRQKQWLLMSGLQGIMPGLSSVSCSWGGGSSTRRIRVTSMGLYFTFSHIPRKQRGQGGIGLKSMGCRGGWATGGAPWLEEVLAICCHKTRQTEVTLRDSSPSALSLGPRPLPRGLAKLCPLP